MLRVVKRATIALLVIGLVSFFGPLLIAALATTASINTPPDPWPPRTEGNRLVTAYRDHEKNKFFLSNPIPPPDGAECGYNPSELFSGGGLLEAAEKQEFTNYFGYFIIDQWRGDFEWESFNTALAEELDANVSQFQLGFLRRCVTTTLARGICMSRIEELIHEAGDNVERSPYGQGSIHHGTTNDVVCLYVDGVAARTGIPLQTKDED